MNDQHAALVLGRGTGLLVTAGLWVLLGLIVVIVGCGRSQEGYGDSKIPSKGVEIKEPLPQETVEIAPQESIEPVLRQEVADSAVESESVATIRFVASEADSGLEFTRYEDFSPQQRIMESTGGGVGIGDFDRDGWPDLLFLDGCKLPSGLGGAEPTCALFRNLGERRFTRVTAGAGLNPVDYSQGVCAGDYDGDGFIDFYITAIGRSSLWRNNGDGTFSDVTEESGVGVSSWSTSCAFADLNRDGLLDLYVVNYLKDDWQEPRLCPNPQAPGGYEQCPPSKYEGLDDYLFVADGTGRFSNQTEVAGMRGLQGKGLGVVIADFDRSGSAEIYVANDGQANFLFVGKDGENGVLAYEQRGLISGSALSRSGYAQASMGIAAGDFDGDQAIDLFLTHFYGDSNTTYRNRGKLRFEDVTRSVGMAGISRQYLGWGTVAADFDHNGTLDLFVANGHVEDRRWQGKGEPYAMTANLFVNHGKGVYRDQSGQAGEYFQEEWLGRGVATADLDGDGRTDLVVSHQRAASSVLWNETRVEHPGVILQLVGTQSNRDGVGCQLEIGEADDGLPLYREVIGGGSFLSASSYEVLVPLLGSRSLRWRVKWPSGREDSGQVNTDSRCLIIEERGIICL